MTRVARSFGLEADQLQFIIDAIPLLVSYVDAQHRYQFNNRAYKEWFGYAPDQLQGRHLRDVLGDAAYEKLRPHLERVLRGESFHFEDEIPYKEGGTRHIHAIYIPDRGHDDVVRGYVAVIGDVSERKLAEERLLESSEVESTLNRIGTVLAGELDVHKIVQAVTDAATKLVDAQFGAFFYNVMNEKGEFYTLYTLSGVPREAFEQFPMPRNTKVFEHTFRGLGIVRSDDITKDPRYGQNAPYYGMPRGHLPVRSYLAVPVISRSGETLGGLFFGHEDPGQFGTREEELVAGLAAQASITVDNARLVEELRRRTAQAEEASRLKDEFLSTASHELRTPLNAILGWARMLRSGVLPPDNTPRAIDVIERNARLQAQLVEDLLEISRINSGKVRLDVRAVSVSHVVEAALDAVGPAAAAKDIRIETTNDIGDGMVMADADRLQQVTWNLLSNAVKFTPSGGRVSVHLRGDAGTVELGIADTGIGIAPEFMPYLFDRFRQGDTGHARQYGGLGLGLAISKQLIELHGGSISAESGGRNQGATFRVRLRATPASSFWSDAAIAPTMQAAAAARFPPEALAGIHVLVVDDEVDARELVQSVLRVCGAQVTMAATAAEALEAMDRQLPDVVLSDIGLPGTSGYSLIREIRRRVADRGGRVPAAALTAYAQNDDRVQALRAGFDLHVPKPLDPSELVAVVQSLARRR